MKVNAQTFDACAAQIASKRKIGKDEALDLMSKVATRANDLRQGGSKDPFFEAVQQLARDLKDNAAKDQGDVLRNQMIRKGVLDDVEKAGGIQRIGICGEIPDGLLDPSLS